MSQSEAIREAVRNKYAAIARDTDVCCGPKKDGCCSDGSLDMIGVAYRGMAGYVAEADLGLGCGLPTRHAGLRPGDTVLDLGSGAGNDVFIASREVGPSGRVVGVDMTPEMIARAEANAAKLGLGNVEFRLGPIESLPVESGSVDVVISNCVLNLVPDKAAAFAEVFRVLKPGAHLCVSDIVATGLLPDPIRDAAALWVGCVAGAMPCQDYLSLLADAGFVAVQIVETKTIDLPDAALAAHLSPAAIASFRASRLELQSVTVRAVKRRGPADRTPA